MKDIPLVGIIMGSDSDLPIMKDAGELLQEFNVPHEITIVSAHRTPDRMREYAMSAVARGLKVIIAGAGGAAHLPGMTASYTTLPVIGVPIKTKTMDGIDSLLSIAQMPAGVPVATVAINGAKNAALLAVEILGVFHVGLAKKIAAYKGTMDTEVKKKVGELAKLGYKKYLAKMK